MTIAPHNSGLMMTLYLSGWQMATYLSIDMMANSQDSVTPSTKKMYIWATQLAKEMVFFGLAICANI